MLKLISCIIVFLASISCGNMASNEKTATEKEKQLLNLKKGEIINCGPPEAQFGIVEFEASCSEKARKDFNLAIALLHSFEYNEAEKVFAKVIDEDPDCAMAYWGVAMCNWHPLWDAPNQEDLEKGSQAIEIANNLKNKSPRESDYVNAIGEFYKNWQYADHKARAIAFEKAMERMYEKYPGDKEVAIFYALALNATANPEDKTYSNQKKAVSILNNVLEENPNHPGIAHYIIHNYDYPELAALALPIARKYAAIAPSSAHAQHMPSHIFTRLGLWDESVASNLASTESAKCYAESAGIKGHWDEELHGIDYLVYAYLQEGKDRKAKDLVEYCGAIDSTYPVNFKVAYAFAAGPVRYALELKLWDVASNLETQPSNFNFEKFPWERSIIHFARVLGAVHINNLIAAKNDLSQMNTFYDLLMKSKHEYQGKQVMIQIKAANAWIKLKEGNSEEAVKLMKESVELEENTAKHPVTPGEVVPARELLGDMWMELHKPKEALEAYELDLKSHPNRFNGLLGAGMAAKESGDLSKALMYFEQLLKNCDQSECKRPTIEKVKNFLTKK